MAKYLDQAGLTYFWGLLKTKLAGKVPTTRTIAGVDLADNITVTELVGKLKGTAANTLAEGNHDHGAAEIGYSNNLLDTDSNVKAALDLIAEALSDLQAHNHDTQYVPLSRTVAGLSLNTNITAANLTAKLSNASASAAGTMTAAQYTKLNALPDNATLSSTYAKKSDISSVYKPAGNITPSNGVISSPKTYLTAANVGNVYHATDAFTADQYFVTPESSKTYPAGTNVVVVAVDAWQDSGGTTLNYKFDVLSGFVDLSGYATKDELAGVSGSIVALTNSEIDTIVAS